MQSSWARIVRFVRNGMEPLIVLLAIVVLREFDLSGSVPLWIIALVLLTGVISQQPAVQLRLSGGDLSKRLWPRVALHISTSTVTAYLTGWGPLLAIAHLHILSMYLHKSGSRAWRPAAVASVVAIGLGQVAYATGLIHPYLTVPQTHAVAVFMAIGVVTTARVFGRAVRERETAEAAVRRSEERFRALVRDGSEVIVEAQADGNVTYVSPASFPVMGYQPEQMRGTALHDLMHPDDRIIAIELYARLLAGDGSVEHTIEVRVRHEDGNWHWQEVIARNLLAHPQVGAIIFHMRDITERRATQDQMAHAAAHDSLTGLANGPTLVRDLERSLAQGARYQHTVGLLFLDLDGFKQVNDTYGHDVGDRLLMAVADVLRHTVRDTDTIGRLGGDEFGVVLTRVGTAAEAMAVASRVVAGIEAHSAVAGLRLEIGCSIGVALSGPGASDAKSLLRQSDAAMYRSKRLGRNGAQLYVDEAVIEPSVTASR